MPDNPKLPVQPITVAVIDTAASVRVQCGHCASGFLPLTQLLNAFDWETAMAIERNGIVFFELTEKYDDHPAFKALKEVSLGDVRFPFGFFLVEEKGKKRVLPGTKEDLLKRLLIAFPDYPTQTLTAPNCSVNAFEDGCEGGCEELGVTFKCRRIYDDPFHYYACTCVDIS